MGKVQQTDVLRLTPSPEVAEALLAQPGWVSKQQTAIA